MGVCLMKMIMQLVALCCAAMATGAHAAGAGQSIPSDCELHVWPGDKLKAVYNGVFHGGTVDGALKGRSGYPPLPQDPLNSARQAALLEAARPQALLGRPEDRLIVHADPLESRVIRTTPGRLSDSGAACYGELVVDDIVFRQDAVSGTVLLTLFRYRRFGPGPAPEYRFANWGKATIKLLPLKPGGDLAAAIAELEAAYVEDLKRFAEVIGKQARPK